MSSTSERLGEQPKEAVEDVEKMGKIVRDAAQEKFAQVSEKAAQCSEQGREKVHGVACQCEQFLRQPQFVWGRT